MKYVKNDVASGVTFNGASWDNSGQFVLTTEPKLYRLNASTLSYVDTGITVNSSFYKTNRALITSTDGTKVIINSWAVNGVNLDYAFEVYFYNGTAWVKVDSKSGTSTSSTAQHQLIASPDFETLVLSYYTNADAPTLEVKRYTYLPTVSASTYPNAT